MVLWECLKYNLKKYFIKKLCIKMWFLQLYTDFDWEWPDLAGKIDILYYLGRMRRYFVKKTQFQFGHCLYSSLQSTTIYWPYLYTRTQNMQVPCQWWYHSSDAYVICCHRMCTIWRCIMSSIVVEKKSVYKYDIHVLACYEIYAAFLYTPYTNILIWQCKTCSTK